jgi:hypothetical protein
MVGWLRQVGMTTRRKVKVGRVILKRWPGGGRDERKKKEKKKDEAKKL